MKKHILFVGIGEAGCCLAEKIGEKISPEICTTVAMDTDENSIYGRDCSACISMSDSRPIGEITEYIGKENISEWFPCDWKNDGTIALAVGTLRNGTGGIRAKGLFAFINMLNDKCEREKFHGIIDSLFDEKNEYNEIDLYIAASLSGGTGSALFYTVALYIEKYVRERFNREINAKAFLISPEVIINSMPNDGRMTAHANCYAALQELLTINRFAYGDTSLPEFTFRIGQSNDPNMGVIFDTSDTRFANKLYAPFNEIYIFDRVPGGADFKAYLIYWSDIISLFAKDIIPSYGKPESCDAIYQSLSLRGLVYSPTHLSGYFASRRVRDIMRSEWSPFFDGIEYSVKYGKRYGGADSTNGFCEAVREYVFNRCGIDGDERNLLADSRMTAYGEDTRVDWKKLFKDAVYSEYKDYFETQNRDIFTECTKKITDPETKKLHWYEKTAKKERIADYVETINKAYAALDGYYAEYIAAIRKINAEMANSDFENSDTFARLLGNIVCDEGEYVSPIVAFARLCLIESDISLPHTGFHKIIADDIKEKKITNIGTLFTAVAQTRFMSSQTVKKLFVNGYDERQINEKLSEEELADVAGFILRVGSVIVSDISASLLDNLLPYIDTAVESYRRVMSATKTINEWLDDSVRISLNKGNDFAGFYTNVGATEEKKIALYEAYFDGSNASDIAKSEDTNIGEIIFKNYFTKTEISLSDIKEMFDIWKDKIIERFEQSNFFNIYCKKNVIEMLFDSKTVRRFDDTAKLLQTPPSPVRYRFGRVKGSKTVTEEDSAIYISENCASAIFEKAKSCGIETEKREETIASFLYNLGNRETVVKEDARIDDDKVFIVRHVRNLRLWQIATFNDCDDTFGLYYDFAKASSLVEKRETQLRNPYICRFGKMKGRMPFINPEKQEIYDLNTVKAMLYAFAHGKIRIRNKENEKKPIVFINVGNGIYPLTESEMFIHPEDIPQLIAWLRIDAALVCEWSGAFDKEVGAAFSGLLSRGFFNADSKPKNTFSFSPVFRLIGSDLFAYTTFETEPISKSLIVILCECINIEKSKKIAEQLSVIISDICEIACMGGDSFILETLRSELYMSFKAQAEEYEINGADIITDILFRK